MIRINLDYNDENLAAVIGYKRTVGCRSINAKENSDVKRTHFENIANQSAGVAAEIAVAKFMCIDNFIPTLNSNGWKQDADVGKNIEVKWSRWLDSPLHIQPTDRDTDIGVLVVNQSPNLIIIGWLPVRDAKKPKYKHSKFAGWAVSQINLHPIETLKNSNYAHIQI